MATYPANPLPNYPLDETPIEPEVLVSVHRDGSEQRRKRGAGRRRTFALKYSAITQAEMQGIIDHWTGQNGMTTSFNWAHPERGTVFVCRYAAMPQFSLSAYNWYDGTVQLQEVPA